MEVHNKSHRTPLVWRGACWEYSYSVWHGNTQRSHQWCIIQDNNVFMCLKYWHLKPFIRVRLPSAHWISNSETKLENEFHDLFLKMVIDHVFWHTEWFVRNIARISIFLVTISIFYTCALVTWKQIKHRIKSSKGLQMVTQLSLQRGISCLSQTRGCWENSPSRRTT